MLNLCEKESTKINVLLTVFSSWSLFIWSGSYYSQREYKRESGF